jgi:hypothetical protein
VTALQIRFITLCRREVNRFMKIKKQTIGESTSCTGSTTSSS